MADVETYFNKACMEDGWSADKTAEILSSDEFEWAQAEFRRLMFKVKDQQTKSVFLPRDLKKIVYDKKAHQMVVY